MPVWSFGACLVGAEGSWPSLVTGAALVGAVACGGGKLPDPKPVIVEYRRAVGAGDAAAVHSLLTADARTAYGPEGTRRLLDDNRTELAALAGAAVGPGAATRIEVTVRFVDGEATIVRVEDGAFRVASAGGFPSAARTPAAALAELRAAVARRSYSALLLLLSRDTRASMERDLASLVSGLEHPESLAVRVRQDTAEVTVPGGHRVLLRREDGAWKIHDFE